MGCVNSIYVSCKDCGFIGEVCGEYSKNLLECRRIRVCLQSESFGGPSVKEEE